VRRLLLCFPVLSLVFLPGCGSSNSSSVSQPPPTSPGISSFAHIVVIIQENRTPDNLFQSMAASGADISANGMCRADTTPCAGADSNGVLPLASAPLAITYDLGHDHAAWLTDFNSGAMDHFAGCTGSGCPTNAPYQYVRASDIQPYIQLAQTYAFADRMFQTNQGPSVPGHLYLSWVPPDSHRAARCSMLVTRTATALLLQRVRANGRPLISKAERRARVPPAWSPRISSLTNWRQNN